ncbi:polysaccharide pyruvyl transferase family protein [uncultured Williamsia sp.]|uniref:polysaccharide pyruvyl transferase family protein n=1 Tax=uncultured Williamsia sp. TaxID=259311 RepID=UPI00260EC4ED|nr:polysaccharide pyruvyl transferase family protein [uncultured Williamsia sp.]
MSPFRSRRRQGDTGSAPLLYLIAPAGIPNFGDELIARSWIRHLARRHPGARVVLDCHTPGTAAVLLRDEHPRLLVVDTVWRIANSHPHSSLTDAIRHMRDAVIDPGVEPHLASGLRLLQQASVVHVVGGGYINAIWPHHLQLLEAARAAAVVGGARTAATGQGLLPESTSSWVAALTDIVGDFDLVDVRDAASAQLLDGLPLPVSHSGDDAWLVREQPTSVYAAPHTAARRWMFVVQSDLVGDDATSSDTASAHIESELRELITRWGIRGDDCAFVEGIPRTDRHTFDRLAPLLPGAQFISFEELWNTGLPARPGQVWVSSRFHFHLLAAAAGAAGVHLPGRTDYYPIKHTSLVDAGSRWIGLDETGSEPPSTPGFDPTTVNRLHAAKRAVADAIYEDIVPT